MRIVLRGIQPNASIHRLEDPRTLATIQIKTFHLSLAP